MRSFTPEALERTLHALEEAAGTLREAGIPPRRTRFFATESLRSAHGIEAVVPAVENAAGFPLQVLSGEEEARLSYEGALLAAPGAEFVFDLGGGSLEVAGRDFRRSFRLGAVRMASLYGDSTERIASHSARVLLGLPRQGKRLVGAGGTSSSAAMMLRRIPWQEYHPAKVQGCRIERGHLGALLQKLETLDVTARRGITGLEPDRADIIVPGLCVIRSLLDCMEIDGYTHSETDILWAQCARAAAGEGRVVERAVF